MYFPGTRAYKGAWQETIAAAEQYNEPGRFTAFIGYEWTSNTGGNNLHRNVVFRDNGDKASQVEPYTVYPPFGSDNPVELWKWMDAYEKKTGGSVLAIAHNGNLSNGLMFPVIEAFGKKLDREYVETRAKWERLYETTQTKGTGESHPYLSPNDEFADFELWDKGNLDGSVAKKKEMLEFEYSRSALKNGLKLEQQLGTNPYKFGLIGCSDAHTGLTAMEEDNFFGKTTPQEPSPERLTQHVLQQPEDGREDHGLGGRRLRLRRRLGHREHPGSALGRDAAQGDVRDHRPAHGRALLRRVGLRGEGRARPDAGERRIRQGRAHGRRPARGPRGQGADASSRPRSRTRSARTSTASRSSRAGSTPRASCTSRSSTWRGRTIASPTRRPASCRRWAAPWTSTNATWTNSIGAPELIAVWKDPGFDPAQRAFYYARVIEIPTPRWTAYDVKRFGNKPLPGTRMTITERAYTAPIWYTPN